MTPEANRFASEMAKGVLEVRFLSPCDCGCGAPAQVLLLVDGISLVITDPADVDRMIATLKEGRAKLWGDP